METQLIPGTQDSGLSTQHSPWPSPAAAYLNGLGSDASRRTMTAALTHVAEIVVNGHASPFDFAWHRLDYTAAQRVRQTVQAKYSPSYANVCVNAMRAVCRAANLIRIADPEHPGATRPLMSADDYLAIAAVKTVNFKRAKNSKAVPTEKIDRLFAACADGTRAGLRDAAIFAVLYMAGPRRAAVVDLDIADYDPETGAVLFREKGNKDNETALNEVARRIVAAWLRVRPFVPGPMFFPIRQNDVVVIRRMVPQSIYDILHQRCAIAGVKAFSPHCLRHSFATHLLKAGQPINIVADLLNHASLETTRLYDNTSDEQKREALKKLYVNYNPLPLKDGPRHRPKSVPLDPNDLANYKYLVDPDYSAPNTPGSAPFLPSPVLGRAGCPPGGEGEGDARATIPAPNEPGA